MENQVTDSSEERTFQYQSSLPSLPVPVLHESLKKYLDSVRPFLNQEEYQRTQDIVKKFENGIGKELQQKLLQRAKVKRNWLEEWWLNVAYLDARFPTQIYCNFGGPGPYIEHYWPMKEGSQIERASIITWFTLKFWELIRTEKLPVNKSDNIPLDMNQFQMLFCTCKIPGIAQDSIVNYFRTESEGECPTHLVTLCRGRIFAFDAVHDGSILSAPELIRQFSYIQKRCHSEPEGPGLAALTSEERTTWAKKRDYLINLDPKNLSLLEKIQSSIFTVCLDEASPYAVPEDYTEVTRLVLIGDPTVRWGDKSYNFIAFSNGTFGSHCDHTPFDGIIAVALGSFLDSHIVESEGTWKGSDKVREIPWPQELVFRLDQKLLKDIAQAKEQYKKQTSDLQLVSYAFTSFGKALIKKQQLHPDTFVQLALQLAYYRLHGHPGCCYETATTRRFYHGRTETLRPCTVEAVEWCRSMLDPTFTDWMNEIAFIAVAMQTAVQHSSPAVPVQRPQLGHEFNSTLPIKVSQQKQLMLKAFAKHNKLMKECMDGRGFDRHLLGLMLLSKEHNLPMPELFLDPAFTRSGGGGNFVLSTSLVGYTRVGGAVVPMVHHGYGFFYRIRDDRIVVACTSWNSCPETDAEKLCKILFQSFQDMIKLMIRAQL